MGRTARRGVARTVALASAACGSRVRNPALRGFVGPVAGGVARIAHGVGTVSYTHLDVYKRQRQGVAEVVYGAGKTPAQMAGIVASMRAAGQERVLVTRLAPEAADELRVLLQAFDPLAAEAFAYHELPRLGLVGGLPEPDGNGPVVIAAAGTSDLPVAEELSLIHI